VASEVQESVVAAFEATAKVPGMAAVQNLAGTQIHSCQWVEAAVLELQSLQIQSAEAATLGTMAETQSAEVAKVQGNLSAGAALV